MQTGCPKCSTIVKSAGSTWKILNGSCTELIGKPWSGKHEYCPILSLVVEPDVILPGLASRTEVQADVDRLKTVSGGR